jgi:hypothetical protein
MAMAGPDDAARILAGDSLIDAHQDSDDIIAFQADAEQLSLDVEYNMPSTHKFELESTGEPLAAPHASDCHNGICSFLLNSKHFGHHATVCPKQAT